MKVLVTGVSGQLGFDVVRVLQRRGVEVISATRNEMPLTEPRKCASFIKGKMPDVVIHCAAYTAVDKAEDEQELCRLVNAGSVRSIAEACDETGAKLIYISTDYVFPGTGDSFYSIDDETGPCNAYGRSKLEGEEAVRKAAAKHFIVRISWVFGINGKNFIRTMLSLAKTHDALTVVNDQIGSPTYTRDLAELLCDMAESEKYGTYHATNEGVCSWFELASEVFRIRGIDIKVSPVPSSAYPTKAVRPHNSRLGKESLDAAGFRRLPDWKDAVKRYLDELSDRGE